MYCISFLANLLSFTCRDKCAILNKLQAMLNNMSSKALLLNRFMDGDKNIQEIFILHI